jgi:large subunit ribosomal protein L2
MIKLSNESPFKSFKPITPGQRITKLLNKSHLLKLKPLKSQSLGFSYGKGRNHSGKITAWHRGKGHKRLYRNIDFNRQISNGLVEGFEYDPNRTSWIIRLFNPDKLKHHYILGVKSLKRGNLVFSHLKEKIRQGNSILLQDLPSGFVIHNLSSGPSKKGQYLRAAGTYGQLILKTSKYARIKLRSGEHRLFPLQAHASLGSVCNEDSKFKNLGKAGRNRWLGRRPIVRGVAINPVDHPHGGGEGKTSGGRPSVTPWGKPTKGQPTVKSYSYLRISLRKQKKKK